MPETSEFDEQKYLLANPDVAKAVREGVLTSGAEHYERYGRQEGRTWHVTAVRSRHEKILNNIDVRGKGLEIGPSHSPIAPKREGFDVDIVDHLSAQGLRQKYSDHQVDTAKIEDVDYIWKGELLSELIKRSEHYDWIIASHVIEHMPDPITFLQQCQHLMKPDGKLALVIPDKRFCFDYLQPISLSGSLLDAFHEKRTRPTPGQIFDYVANACGLEQTSAWSTAGFDSLHLLHDFHSAVALWHQACSGSDYFDAHCWRFTPSSFKLIISDLNTLGIIKMSTIAEYDTDGNEFFCILSKVRIENPPTDRLKLLADIDGLIIAPRR